MDTFTYGNGTTVKYGYDHLNRQTSTKINNVLRYNKLYDGLSRLLAVEDILLGRKVRYEYDILNRAVSERLINTTTNKAYADLKIRYDDTKNRVAGYDVNIEGINKATDFVYGGNGLDPDIITSVKHNSSTKLSYAYDSLNRLKTRTIGTSTPFVTEYSFLEGNGSSRTTTLVRTVKNGSDTLQYAYDKLGNISEIRKNGTVIESYTYDNLNQLKTVTNGTDTWEYTYDNGGNILSVKKNGVVEKSYTYGDTEWKDLLTNFNGTDFTYDAIGNPLTYRDNMSFTWADGRKLASITKGTNNYSYTYDLSGLRTSKTVNGVTTEYYWLNGQLQGQKTGSEHIIYLYDENGSAYGFLVYENGAMVGEYYYIFNVQGDVIGILDSTGTKVVEYTYNAWGEILSTTGTLADTIGQKNPLRYRGYYFDSETNFYYLQSRYYDPVIGRFVNADGVVAGTGGSISGYNLFSYCFNNPVNLEDDAGNWPKWLKGALNIVSGVTQIVAGAALGAFTSWTGVGAAAGGILIANGIGTTMLGVNQVSNAVTKSNTLPEINVPREVTKKVGKAVGGNTGEKVAATAYDATVAAAGVYAGSVPIKSALQQAGLSPIKVNINKVLNNPMDEFVTCGPAPGVIRDYCRSIPLNGYGKIYATQLPNGFYQLANGHHRVAALRSLGKETIKIFLTK